MRNPRDEVMNGEKTVKVVHPRLFPLDFEDDGTFDYCRAFVDVGKTAGRREEWQINEKMTPNQIRHKKVCYEMGKKRVCGHNNQVNS
jgi:hypothetical protein